ncbi:MAG: ACT domain-containing protein [Isosphaeraceae bacterium]|nr:ACT domain-containing protein [Isosphaeraceae bacterium]
MAETRRRFILRESPGRFAIVRLEPESPPPGWAFRGPFWSITRTSEELSLIVEESGLPSTFVEGDGGKLSRGWAMFRLAGTFELTGETGVVASISEPIARAGVAIFVLSTFDTDHLLIPVDRLDEARAAWIAAGHVVE